MAFHLNYIACRSGHLDASVPERLQEPRIVLLLLLLQKLFSFSVLCGNFDRLIVFICLVGGHS